MSMKKEMTSIQKMVLGDIISSDLEKQDLGAWQQACKSFGPFNYNETTRKGWFEKNKNKVPIGKKILLFVDKWAKVLRKEEKFSTVAMTTIRNEIIEAIRKEQGKQGFEKNKLNSFKLATFRTLVSWADDPSKLEEGPYEGSKKLPLDKRKVRAKRKVRKSSRFSTPQVNLVKDVKAEGSRTIKLTIAIINRYIHPYQNVELELKFDSGLSVKSSTPYKWSSSDKTIQVGFLPASLDDEPLETLIKMKLGMTKTAESYSISGTIRFDDCQKGERASVNIEKESIHI